MSSYGIMNNKFNLYCNKLTHWQNLGLSRSNLKNCKKNPIHF